MLAAGAFVLAAPPLVRAEQAHKVFRVGYLSFYSKAANSAPGGYLRTVTEGLHDLGWVEGQNYVLEPRFAQDENASLPELAVQLVSSKPDVIMVESAGNAAFLIQQTKTIPIVVLYAGLLTVDEGVATMAKPGGNVTGMQIYSPELMGKRMQLLKELVPDLRRVAVLRGDNFPKRNLAMYREATDAAATALHIDVSYLEFKNPEELDPLFSEMIKGKVQSLMVWGNPQLLVHKNRIYTLAARYRLPAVYEWRSFSDGLIVYGPRVEDVLREGATYVDRILKGAKPGELPVGQPRTFELVFNLKAAKAIGLTFPAPLLQRADELIQ